MRIMALDFGKGTVGVAIGDTQTKVVQGCGFVSMRKTAHGRDCHWEKLVKYVNEWQPKHIVVGNPLLKSGKSGSMSKQAKKFAAQVQERTEIECSLWDERYSSQEARNLWDGQDPTDLHALSAQVILETWLAGADV